MSHKPDQESYHLPIKEKEIPRASGSGLPPDGSKVKDDELEELMRKLGNAPGMDGMNFKMFKPDDFKGKDGNIDSEKMEEMLKASGGKGYRKKPERQQKQDL